MSNLCTYWLIYHSSYIIYRNKKKKKTTGIWTDRRGGGRAFYSLVRLCLFVRYSHTRHYSVPGYIMLFHFALGQCYSWYILFIFIFFHPVYHLAFLFSPFELTQIQGHKAGSSPSSPLRYCLSFSISRTKTSVALSSASSILSSNFA